MCIRDRYGGAITGNKADSSGGGGVFLIGTTNSVVTADVYKRQILCPARTRWTIPATPAASAGRHSTRAWARAPIIRR